MVVAAICPRKLTVSARFVSSVDVPDVFVNANPVPQDAESQYCVNPAIEKSVWPLSLVVLSVAARLITAADPILTSPENPTAVPVCDI